MRRYHNKEGPDFDVGYRLSRHPRDGTGRKARDETTGNTREGTFLHPRGETIPVRGSPENRHYFQLITGPPKDPRHSCKPSSRWRRGARVNRPFGPVKGEVCPVEFELFTMTH